MLFCYMKNETRIYSLEFVIDLFMRFWSNLKTVIYKLDFFTTSEVLRYKEEPQYRTLFGGILSISIIILLLATFYNKVIDTFEKVIISSSLSSLNADDPTLYTISTMSGNHFMLGVQIWHHDLSANPRYFDVVLRNVFYDSGEQNINKSVIVPLQPCTKDHWAQYPKIQQNYDRLKVNYWLCLPLNNQFQIYGKYASITSKTLEVAVKKCSNASDPSRPCAPQTDIDLFFQAQKNFYYTVYFINPLINADSQEFLSYYLQDSNYAIFSAIAGEECQLLMEDYTITTDQSIIPFADQKVQTGGIVTKNCIKNRYFIDVNDPNTIYSTMIIFKSPISRSISRSFQKIDEILSYIGGLFGTIAICLFLVNVYNSYSFEITMGGYLFKPDDHDMEKQLKKYNFFYFIMHLLYALISMFTSNCRWQTAKLYHQCRQEMIKQLDVLYLFRRLAFVERAVSTLFTTHQIKALHLYQKISLTEAQQIRKRYKINHDSFLYRACSSGSEGIEEIQMVDLRKREEEARYASDQKIPENPNIIVTGNQINSKIRSSKNSMLPLTSENGNKAELSESSDSDQENEKKIGIEATLRELSYLKNESRKSQLSKKIWNSLGEQIKGCIASCSFDYLQQHRHFHLDDNGQVLFSKQDEQSFESLNHPSQSPKGRKPGLLPKLMFPQQIKIDSRSEDIKREEPPRKREDSEEFIQLTHFSPNKKERTFEED